MEKGGEPLFPFLERVVGEEFCIVFVNKVEVDNELSVAIQPCMQLLCQSQWLPMCLSSPPSLALPFSGIPSKGAPFLFLSIFCTVFFSSSVNSSLCNSLLFSPYRYVVNVRSSYIDETAAMVNYLINDRRVSRISIFYQNDSFGLAGYTGLTRASLLCHSILIMGILCV